MYISKSTNVTLLELEEGSAVSRQGSGRRGSQAQDSALPIIVCQLVKCISILTFKTAGSLSDETLTIPLYMNWTTESKSS